MAYIVRDEDVTKSHLTSPLVRADWEQRIDLCKMAQKNWGECRRLWNEFAAQMPDEARLVAKMVASDHQETAKANQQVNKVLARAESALLTKSYKPPKPGKAARKAAKAAGVPVVTKSARKAADARAAAVRAGIEADLYSDDPGKRMIAAEILGRIR